MPGSISLISDVISILYALRGVYVVTRLVRNWGGFWDATVTPVDRRLANEAAFYLLIPLGVFLHEAGHALATWSVGGQVLEFQWRVFWGYIIPVGNFTPLEDWWIALAGNLVSIALGLLPLPLLLMVRRGIWAAILESFARQQLLYALVWYPAFTFFGLGDWVTIYNFGGGAAPWPYLMLVVHLALLAGLYWLNRSPWLAERRLSLDPTRQRTKIDLETAMAQQPLAAAPPAKLALLYAEAGELGLARRYLRRAEGLNANDSAVQMARARLAVEQNSAPAADKAAQAALSGDLPAPTRAMLLMRLAANHMEAGRREQAIAGFSEVIALMPEHETAYFWRGMVRRSLGRNVEALNDFERAAQVAQDPAAQARARQEVETTRARL